MYMVSGQTHVLYRNTYILKVTMQMLKLYDIT